MYCIIVLLGETQRRLQQSKIYIQYTVLSMVYHDEKTRPLHADAPEPLDFVLVTAPARLPAGYQFLAEVQGYDVNVVVVCCNVFCWILPRDGFFTHPVISFVICKSPRVVSIEEISSRSLLSKAKRQSVVAWKPRKGVGKTDSSVAATMAAATPTCGVLFAAPLVRSTCTLFFKHI